jgi:hypothetical protein
MGAFGFVTMGDFVYLTGGAKDRLGGEPSGETWRWDPVAGLWDQMNPIPRTREHLTAVAFADRLYAIGGRVHGMASPELGEALDIFDPSADSWEAGPPLAPPRSGLNGAAVTSGVLVAGGETPDLVFANVDWFEPRTSRWTALPMLPFAVHGVAVATVCDHVVTLGGSTAAGAIQNTTSVWKYQLGGSALIGTPESGC